MLNLIMYKKIVLSLLLIILVLKIPISSQAAPENAPFVLKDALTGVVDLSEFKEEIEKIWIAINAIPSEDSGSIKVYDSNNQYVGIFAGKSNANYSILIKDYLFDINPITLSSSEIPTYYTDQSCTSVAKYIKKDMVDPNKIYVNSLNQYLIYDKYSQNNLNSLYTYTIDGCVSVYDIFLPLVLTEKPIVDNLQAPLQLRYE